MTRKRDELLDHDADGIREFDNDLPRWWLYGFYFTIVFGVVYFVNYHMLASPFMGEKTVVAEYREEMAAAAAAAPQKPVVVSTALVALTDADSLAKGKAIFESQTHPCVACHRADLGGLVGPESDRRVLAPRVQGVGRRADHQDGLSDPGHVALRRRTSAL